MRIKIYFFANFLFFFINILRANDLSLVPTPFNYSSSEFYLEDSFYPSSVNPIYDWFWQKNEPEEKIDHNPFRADNIKDLEQKLRQRLIGQDQAIKQTVAALERYANGMSDPNAPIASLLYVGPTGVGKTQLVKELADILLDSKQSIIKLNLSEFTEPHSITRLLGSPPGYLNHEDGGQLTKALKRNPNTIILLDEIEKAHPTILKVFLQLLEEGFISDSKGQLIDCRQSMFIMTTNLAGQRILTMHDLGHKDHEILASIHSTLTNKLSPELYNRLEPVIFRGLRENVWDDLIQGMLFQATHEVLTRKEIVIEFDSSIRQFIKKRAANYELGARPFKQMIKQTVMTAIAEALKQKYIKEKESITISYANGHIIIQSSQKEQAFLWKYIEDEKNGIQAPFQLNQLLDLEDRLQQKVLGQPYAIKMTVAALIRFAAGLGNETSPIGSFLYVGPTGVGKTQLAKELAIELLGKESHLIRLDMSEYSEAHTISRLIGSPPGYVNHEEGGQLTEALKKHPYAIVLLDEIDKAHPVVLKAFLQVFDEGHISDAQGSFIDCRQSIFILTTNLASQNILKLHAKGYPELKILENVQSEIMKFISPELYNRLEVAPFMGLGKEHCDQLIQNMLKSTQDELQDKKKIKVTFDPSFIIFLQEHGFDVELGARPLKRLIQRTVITSIAKEIIAGHLQAGDTITFSYFNNQIVIDHSEFIKN